MEQKAFEMAQVVGYEQFKLQRKIGEVESVKIKCLPIRKFAEYATVLEDESACVELFTGLTQDEVDNLHRDDFVKILERGHALNLNPFSEWLKRKKAMSAKADKIWNSMKNQDGSNSVENSQE